MPTTLTALRPEMCGAGIRCAVKHPPPNDGSVPVCLRLLDLRVAPERVEADLCLLDGDERERAARFRFPEHRRRFIACRAGLRRMLGQCLGREPDRLRFVTGPFGKPALAASAGAEVLHFNVSHSDDLALVAVAQGREVGVDIERRRDVDDLLETVARRFAPAECAELADAAPADRTRIFFDLWTRKEAVVKATGLGLQLPLDRFSVPAGPLAGAVTVRMPGEDGQPREWALCDLAVPSPYSAALALEGPAATLHNLYNFPRTPT